MRTWTTRTEDKERWGEGPWDNEPDVVHWISPSTGLNCLMLRGPMGSWCGYVGLQPGHPWWGRVLRDHDEDQLPLPPEVYDLEVHGGITWAGNDLLHGIGDELEEDLWWIGFDCGHLMDEIPQQNYINRVLGLPPPPDGREYRGIEYVGAETENLARQIARLFGE